ncbi:MAG: GNAT family N-acetyltransferase, partial [Alphaproteobacteria bacterium]
VGFATVFPIPYAYAAKPSLELEMLYVTEPWRAQGVGRALMDAVLDHAKATGCERVEWNVLADNARAQAFYKSLGAAEKTGWRRWVVIVD